MGKVLTSKSASFESIVNLELVIMERFCSPYTRSQIAQQYNWLHKRNTFFLKEVKSGSVIEI